MRSGRKSMRSSNQPLSEMTIKVPAPFAGISDLGFTAQYRSQNFQEPLRDVPLLIEGPRPPMRRLAELLQLLRGIEGTAYAWSDPVMLSRSEEHTSELQSRRDLVCRLLLEKKKITIL